MSPFHTITILTALTILGAGSGLQGPGRWCVPGIARAIYFILLLLGVFILRLNYFIKAHCRGETTKKQVALTFDDGPEPEATPNFLRVLERHGVKVTFFPTGRKCQAFPEIIKQIDLAGRDCLKYADIMLSWVLGKVVERTLN